MSLTEKLSDFNRQSKAKRSEETNAIMAKATEELIQSGIAENAPRKGGKLPEFTLPDQLGEKRNLTELRKNGPVVVMFYRGGWCPYCNLELAAYQEALPEIRAAGATLVAITPELPDASLSTAEKHALEFEVLTDINADYARQIGIVFTLPEKLRSLYESFGHNIEEYNGTGQFDLPLPATFIVDTDGTIVSAFVDADYTLRKDPEEIIKELSEMK